MNTSGKQQFDEAARGASPVSGERESGASIDQDDGQLALPLSSGRHIMRAEELEHDGKASGDALSQSVEETTRAMPERAPQKSFGQRLREAREAKGLSRGDVAQRLRLPLRLIARLEDDDYAGMDEGVYLRGYLSSYARLVEVPVVAAETVAAQHAHAAPLVATGKVSRSRYLFDRYSVSATYLILTGLIVVPAVWLATHGGLEQNLARTTPLDSPVATIQVPPPALPESQSASATEPAGDAAPEPAATETSEAPSTAAASELPRQEQMPVVASMAPFAAPTTTPAPAAEPAAKTGPAGAHSLVLKLTAASWVEIIGADGNKLEYGILPAGTERTYTSDAPLSVRLGNAEGADVTVDGAPIDLAPYRHANVARLKVFGPDGVESPPADF
jgi:cytoskeleton protein RodZ